METPQQCVAVATLMPMMSEMSMMQRHLAFVSALCAAVPWSLRLALLSQFAPASPCHHYCHCRHRRHLRTQAPLWPGVGRAAARFSCFHWPSFDAVSASVVAVVGMRRCCCRHPRWRRPRRLHPPAAGTRAARPGHRASQTRCGTLHRVQFGVAIALTAASVLWHLAPRAHHGAAATP